MNLEIYVNGILCNGKKDKKNIWKNYISKHFYVDLTVIISIIFDIFFYNSFENHGNKYHNSLIDTNYNLITELPKIGLYVKLYDFKRSWENVVRQLGIAYKFGNFLRLFKLIFVSFFVSHLFASFFHFISIWQLQKNNDTWLQARNLINSPIRKRYLESYYWTSITMMTVGYGDIIPANSFETIYSIVTVLFGCGMFAYFVNSIGAILTEINKSDSIYKQKFRTISEYMAKKNIDAELTNKIENYLKYVWKEENNILNEEAESIINELSDNLQDELRAQAAGKLFNDKHIFNQNFSEESLSEALKLVKELRFNPNELIFGENDPESDEIFFIEKGEIEIFHYNNSENIVNVNDPDNRIIGESFGDFSFFTNFPRHFCAKSCGFSTLYSLKREDFLKEAYCFIRDKIICEKDLSELEIRCNSCTKKGHYVIDCPIIHYCPDKEKILKNYVFPHYQYRYFMKRRTLKSNLEIIEKSKDFELEESTESEYSESDQEVQFNENFNPFKLSNSPNIKSRSNIKNTMDFEKDSKTIAKILKIDENNAQKLIKKQISPKNALFSHKSLPFSPKNVLISPKNGMISPKNSLDSRINYTKDKNRLSLFSFNKNKEKTDMNRLMSSYQNNDEFFYEFESVGNFLKYYPKHNLFYQTQLLNGKSLQLKKIDKNYILYSNNIKKRLDLITNASSMNQAEIFKISLNRRVDISKGLFKNDSQRKELKNVADGVIKRQKTRSQTIFKKIMKKKNNNKG